jgi:hypothetical protein
MSAAMLAPLTRHDVEVEAAPLNDHRGHVDAHTLKVQM